MSSDSDSAPTQSKKKAYDLKFKLDAIKYAEKNNKYKAASVQKIEIEEEAEESGYGIDASIVSLI